MINSLHPIKREEIKYKNVYEISVFLTKKGSLMGVHIFATEKEAIDILNQFENKKLTIKYLDKYFEEDYSNYTLDALSLRCYYDEYGRECEVIKNKNYDINYKSLIYNTEGEYIYEDSSSITCYFLDYAKDIKETFSEIVFKVYKEDMNRYFLFYDTTKEYLSFVINKETLDLMCINNPKLTINLKVKNINN
jgi:hypothetical protein